jgi:hypothetical protein
MIYFAYFHAIIKYGIIFWDYSTDSKSLSAINKNSENYDRD